MQSIGQRSDKRRQAGAANHLSQFLIRRCWSHEVEVQGQGSVEQNWISRQVTDKTAQTFEFEAPNILASDANRPGIHVIHPHDELGQGALAGAVLSNDSYPFTGRDSEGRDM